MKRCFLLVVVLAAFPARAPAQDAELLTRARIIRELPPLLREAWLAYLDSSTAREQRDRAVLAAELRQTGAARPQPATAGPVFTVTAAMTEEWFQSEEARRIADIVLSYQTPSGGWSKRIDMRAQPRQPGQAWTASSGWSYVGTFDNDGTTEQIRFLGLIYEVVRDERYLNGFLRGLDYLFDAQMPNGCWPQVYPLQGDYHDAATFNDDMMAHILRLLRDVWRATIDVAPEETRRRARSSYDGGIDCLLSSQVIVNGVRAAWGAQHDPLTLRPVGARAYEHASLSGGESVELVEVLMEVQNPDARTQHAVHSAMDWFERSAIGGFEYINGALAARPGAAPIWARFYELGTNRPIFSNRDGRVLYDYNELDQERREGYAWFRSTPRDLFERYRRWAQRYPR